MKINKGKYTDVIQVTNMDAWRQRLDVSYLDFTLAPTQLIWIITHCLCVQKETKEAGAET